MMDNPAIYTTPGDDRLEAAERRITELEAENTRLGKLYDTERADAERFLSQAQMWLDDDGDLDFEGVLCGIKSMRSRLELARRDTRCPECGCCDHIDAEANECGCDCIVCSHDGGETLAELTVRLQTENMRLLAEVERLRGALEILKTIGEAEAALRGESEAT